MIPILGSTKGIDILVTSTTYFKKRGIDIWKIFAVTTDDAPTMVGQHCGFVSLVEEKIWHPVMKLHCIFHQKNLLNATFNDVMSTATKTVNFLVACSAMTQ